MLTATVETEPTVRTGRSHPNVRRGAVLVAAAWLVPSLTHLAGVDWLLPILILAATAGLLRAGRSMLDRVVLAVVLLAGATCAAGLLFTVWPFGLAPVPVAGVALTALAALHVATGRPWQMPRPTLGDVLTLGTTAVVAWYVAWPYLRTDQAGRLALLMGGEDHARHVTMFDTLRRIGGYAYWQTPADVPDMIELLRFYPSGWHMNAGLLDGFVRSSAEHGAMPGVVDHYVGFVLAGYALLALVVLWAAQWVAGPLLTLPRRLPLLAALAVFLIYGDLPVFTIFGFPSQAFGLTLLAVLIAILARNPVAGVRDLALLVAALVVGIGFSYHLYLPPAVLATAVWAWRNRRRLRPHLWFLAAVAAVAGPLALVQPVIGVLYGSNVTIIRASGPVLPASRGLLLALGLLVVAAVLSRAGRRLQVWRSYVWTAAVMASLPVALWVYRVLTDSSATYYHEKTLHGLLVLLLIGCGGLVLLAPVPHRRIRVQDAGTAALVAAAVAVAGGLVINDVPYRPSQAEQLARRWHSGQQSKDHPFAGQVMRINAEVPAQPGMVTLVLTDDMLSTYLHTLYLTMLQRTSSRTQAVMYAEGPADRLAEKIDQVPDKVLVVVTTPGAQELVDEVRRIRPDLVFDDRSVM